jgi:spermidine synthase
MKKGENEPKEYPITTKEIDEICLGVDDKYRDRYESLVRKIYLEALRKVLAKAGDVSANWNSGHIRMTHFEMEALLNPGYHIMNAEMDERFRRNKCARKTSNLSKACKKTK